MRQPNLNIRNAKRRVWFNQTIPGTGGEQGRFFEGVIYGGESEIDSEEGAQWNAQPKRSLKSTLKRSNSAARLRPDGNDPMDLLEGVGAHGLICEHSYSLNDFVIRPNLDCS